MLGSKGCSLSSTDGSEEEYFPAASSSSEEEDSGESTLKTKTRCQMSDMGGKTCQEEDDEDQPVKRKRKLNTYKRRKKSTESVKNSDSLVVATTRKVNGSKKYHQIKTIVFSARNPNPKLHATWNVVGQNNLLSTSHVHYKYS